MNKKEALQEWNSVARALRRTIDRAQALPEREQDSEFNEQLHYVFCHAHKMCRLENSRIDNEQLRYRWEAIARDLDHIMKRTKKLVEDEQGSHLSEKLYELFLYADDRASALIDVC